MSVVTFTGEALVLASLDDTVALLVERGRGVVALASPGSGYSTVERRLAGLIPFTWTMRVDEAAEAVAEGADLLLMNYWLTEERRVALQDLVGSVLDAEDVWGISPRPGLPVALLLPTAQMALQGR